MYTLLLNKTSCLILYFLQIYIPSTINMKTKSKTTESLLRESRTFKPHNDFTKNANVISHQFTKEQSETKLNFGKALQKSYIGLRNGQKHLSGNHHMLYGLKVERLMFHATVLIDM